MVRKTGLMQYWLEWLAAHVESGATVEEFLELAEIALTSAVDAATAQVGLEYAQTMQGNYARTVQAAQNWAGIPLEAPGPGGHTGFGESDPG